jgi:hypothetical protein
MTEIMKPIVNINGTSRTELIEQRIDARRAVTALMETLQHMVPNGRDYIGNQEAFDRDRAIYRERFAALDALYNTLLDEALNIQDS